MAPDGLVDRTGAGLDRLVIDTEMGARRLVRMTHNARNLDAAGHLRAGLTVEHAGELLWTYSSPELFESSSSLAAGTSTATPRSSATR